MSTLNKKIPHEQHECLCSMLDFFIEHGSQVAIPTNQTPEGLKPYNLLLRRGFVTRFEFTDRRFGYKITNAGQDYIVSTEPDSYSFVGEPKT